MDTVIAIYAFVITLVALTLLGRVLRLMAILYYPHLGLVSVRVELAILLIEYTVHNRGVAWSTIEVEQLREAVLLLKTEQEVYGRAYSNGGRNPDTRDYRHSAGRLDIL